MNNDGFGIDLSEIIKNTFVIAKCSSLSIALAFLYLRAKNYLKKQDSCENDVKRKVKFVFAKMVKKISLLYILMMVIVAIYELNPECLSDSEYKPGRKFLCRMQSPYTIYYMILANFVCLSILIVFIENINETMFHHYILGQPYPRDDLIDQSTSVDSDKFVSMLPKWGLHCFYAKLLIGILAILPLGVKKESYSSFVFSPIISLQLVQSTYIIVRWRHHFFEKSDEFVSFFTHSVISSPKITHMKRNMCRSQIVIAAIVFVLIFYQPKNLRDFFDSYEVLELTFRIMHINLVFVSAAVFTIVLKD